MLEKASCSSGTGTTGTPAENSEVLLASPVAVAVTIQFAGTETGRTTLKFDEQMVPKVKLAWPRKSCPSP